MRISELLVEGPTIADVIRSAAQPTPQAGQQAQPPGTKPTTTTTGTQPPGMAAKIGQVAKSVTNLGKDAEGNKINWSSAVASKDLYNKDGTDKTDTQSTAPADLTKIPPAQIQQHLRPGQQVDLGNLGKVKVGQVTAQGVEFDGTGTPIGAKFTVPLKSLTTK